MLAWTIYISFLGAAGLVLLPAENRRAARILALLTALAGLALALGGAAQYELRPTSDTLVELVNISWIRDLGIHYHLAADGVSVTLVLLTGIAAVAGVLFSWNVERRTREFFALYFALIGGVYGVFLSFDLFLLFVFYEIAIVPKYFLIAVWGSTRREYGAMKLALYSFAGSAMVLIGLMAAYVVSGAQSFDLLDLAKQSFPVAFQHWAFVLVFVGFGVLAGLWPFHTWAPTGHVAAPTAASMLLAGVVMKLGAYGALRVAMILFPEGLRYWQNWIALLAVIGIVYGGTVALVQRDLKFVIGYSSVSHMGFVLLGFMTLSQIGLSGAVLQMFSHGIIAGLLFAVVGRMVYDRAHTRELSKLEAMNLGVLAPFAAVTFVIAGAASMGLPGFSGFIAELQVLTGAWAVFPRLTILAGVGILVGMAFMVRVWIKTFFGEKQAQAMAVDKVARASTPASSSGVPPDGAPTLAAGRRQNPQARTPALHFVTGPEAQAQSAALQIEPISIPERVGACLLLGTTVLIGLWPGLLLNLITPTLRSPLFQPLWKGGQP